MIVRDVWPVIDCTEPSRDRMLFMNNASEDDFIGTMNSVYGSNANTKYRMYARWKRKMFSKCCLPLPLAFGILSTPTPPPNRCALEMLLHSSLNCVRAPKNATWSKRNNRSWSSCLNSWRVHIFLHVKLLPLFVWFTKNVEIFRIQNSDFGFCLAKQWKCFEWMTKMWCDSYMCELVATYQCISCISINVRYFGD